MLKPLGPKSGTYDPPTDQLYDYNIKETLIEYIKENKDSLDPTIIKWVNLFNKIIKEN